jgi:hypothetical protein
MNAMSCIFLIILQPGRTRRDPTRNRRSIIDHLKNVRNPNRRIFDEPVRIQAVLKQFRV